MNLEKLNEKIRKTFPEGSFEVIEYLGMREPFTIKCLNCGSVYHFQSAQNFFTRKICCKNCIDTPEWSKQKEKFKEWINLHPEFELVDDLTLIHNSQSHIRCKCTMCGRIQENKKVYDYYNGKKCYCQTKSCKKPQDQINKDFADICIFLEPYKNTDTPILLKSNFCGHIFKARPGDLLRNKYQCPICKSSKGEKRILSWLEYNKISYERQKVILLNHKKLKIDFYLPEQDIYIEYNGEQHYRPVDFFGGEEAFKNQCERDNQVRSYLKSQDKKLVEISYENFDEIEEILTKEVFG